MLKNNPTISVVIPLFNKYNSIARSIKSVLRQSYNNFEILVINDGSTDNSELVVKTFDDHRIKLIEQVNSGVSSARNKGIEHASGDYVAFLDADDYWDEDLLSSFVNDYYSFSNIEFWACGYSFVSSDDQRTACFSVNPIIKNYFIYDYFSASLKDPIVTSSSVIVATNLIKKIRGFPNHEGSGEDLLTWIRLSEISNLFFNSKKMSNYTFDGKTNTNLKAKIIGEDWVVFKYLRDNLSLKKNKIFDYYILLVFRRSGLMIRQGNYVDAFKLITSTINLMHKQSLKKYTFKMFVTITKLNLLFLRTILSGFLKIMR